MRKSSRAQDQPPKNKKISKEPNRCSFLSLSHINRMSVMPPWLDPRDACPTLWLSLFLRLWLSLSPPRFLLPKMAPSDHAEHRRLLPRCSHSPSRMPCRHPRRLPPSVANHWPHWVDRRAQPLLSHYLFQHCAPLQLLPTGRLWSRFKALTVRYHIPPVVSTPPLSLSLT